MFFFCRSSKAKCIIFRLIFGNSECCSPEDVALRKIDWVKLENKQIESPFKAKVKSVFDVSNFDPDFTSETPRLSQIDVKLLKTIDEEIFKDFSFVMKGFKV
ncbi:kinase C theta type [Brachionus plicatilis]|uniref:Kinase C theta type n=1 Tax=Brachionus plicatilis TaxID=10195 RepID=A0A3M7PDA9_BRAPC|nr:kinase C theta type [Brachionus plicatilis]